MPFPYNINYKDEAKAAPLQANFQYFEGAYQNSFHSNVNDPTVGEKEALAGTSGTPGNANRYVTDQDSRNTNNRTPTVHANEAHDPDYATEANFGAHTANTNNPHSTTKAQVGLGNVTDDSQLKRAAQDFLAFTEKALVEDGDLFLIEDEVAAFVKKRIGWAGIVDSFTNTMAGGTVVGETGIGQSPAAGSSPYYSRRDHTHGTPSAGTPVAVGDSNSAGTSGDVTRGNHVHAKHTDTPTATQKAALAGTNGTPGDTNRYVTNSDSRFSNLGALQGQVVAIVYGYAMP